MSLLPFTIGYDRPRAFHHHHHGHGHGLGHSHGHWPSRIHDQDFALALTPEDILTALPFPMMSEDYFRTWKQLSSAVKDAGSSIKVEKDKFQVNLDVQHFSPEEISVKTAEGYIVVEGKHEEKKDEHGFVSRQFMRRYVLPEGTAPETVESRLSSDGVLTITAPRNTPDALKGERQVPIAQTGPVRKEIKEQNGETKKPEN